jgi:hypothetical protein
MSRGFGRATNGGGSGSGRYRAGWQRSRAGAGVFHSAFRHILWRLLRRGSPGSARPGHRLTRRNAATWPTSDPNGGRLRIGTGGRLHRKPHRAASKVNSASAGLQGCGCAHKEKCLAEAAAQPSIPIAQKLISPKTQTYGARDRHRALGAVWTSAATQGRSRRPQERVNEAPELRHRREFRAACEAYDVCIVRWYIRINNRLRRTTRTGKFFGHGISQEPLIQCGRISDRSSDQTTAPTLGMGGR